VKPALERASSARLKSCLDTKLTPFEFFSSLFSHALTQNMIDEWQCAATAGT
jgi:hypothetical protein